MAGKKVKLEKPGLDKIVDELKAALIVAFDPAKLRQHVRAAMYMIEARRMKTVPEVALAMSIARGEMKTPSELFGAAEHALQIRDVEACAELLNAAGAPGLAQLVAMCQPALEAAWADEGTAE